MENPKQIVGYAPHTVMSGASFLEHTMNGQQCPGVWFLLSFEATKNYTNKNYTKAHKSYVCSECHTSVGESAPSMFAEIAEEHIIDRNKRVTLSIKIRAMGQKLIINDKEFNINEQDPSTDFYNIKFDGYKFEVDGEKFTLNRQTGGWMIFHHRANVPKERMPEEILNFDDQEYSTITIQIAC